MKSNKCSPFLCKFWSQISAKSKCFQILWKSFKSSTLFYFTLPAIWMFCECSIIVQWQSVVVSLRGWVISHKCWIFSFIFTIYWLRVTVCIFTNSSLWAELVIESRCPFVCLNVVPSQLNFFRGLSLALRSHDQIPASHWSTLLPYHMVVVGGIRQALTWNKTGSCVE